jgi:hypothetical protein
MLEEGLAVWFSRKGPTNYGPGYKMLTTNHIRTDPGSVNCRDAPKLYKEVEDAESDCIRRLRAKRT